MNVESLLAGDALLALFAVLLIAGSYAFERAMLVWRTNGWFTASLPLGRELVALPRAPSGSGETRSLAWEVDEEAGLVRWWVKPGQRPSGLHGVVWLVEDHGGRVHLDVRWAPLWTPFLALLWMVPVGVTRGEGPMAGTLAALLMTAILASSWLATPPIAAELRWSLAGGQDADRDGPETGTDGT